MRLVRAIFQYVLLLGISLPVLCAHTENILNIATYDEPPYQVVSPEGISGSSIDTMSCILQKLGWQYTLKAYPLKRAMNRLADDEVDAVLSVTLEYQDTDFPFSYSDPVALEKWFLYSHTMAANLDAPFSRNGWGRLGVVMGSSEELWLTRRGYQVSQRVMDLNILLNMFAMKRFDSILVGFYELHSPEYVERASDMDNVHSYFVKYAPKTVAFSQQFTQTHDNFVALFDREIGGCVSINVELDTAEQAIVQMKAEQIYQDIQAIPFVVESVHKQNLKDLYRHRSLDELEREWLEPNNTLAKQALLKQVYENALADRLRQIKTLSSKLIREIMIVDRYGYNAAITGLTSDFYQGDEAKYEKIMGRDQRDIFISPIMYDRSTARFLTHISFPLIRDSHKVGVVVIGLDAEAALANERLEKLESDR